MPDWKSFVRDRLHLSGLDPAREADIIEDVARQLEDVYQETLRNGGTEPEAAGSAETAHP